MTDLTEGIRNEIEKRELEFVRMLQAANLPKLATYYNDLVTLRHASRVLSAVRSWETVSSKDGVTVTKGSAPHVPPPRLAETNGAFVLRTAVRNQIAQFGKKRFRTRDMYEALNGKYPDQVNESKKASVSATLANLTTMGEVVKIVDGQRKIWFQAA